MKDIKQFFTIIIICSVLVVGINVVLGSPNQDPPGGNINAPINIGALSQHKEGFLGIAMTNNPTLALEVGGPAWIWGLFETLDDTNLAIIDDPKLGDSRVGIGTTTPSEKFEVKGKIRGTGFCIGGRCKSEWPLWNATIKSVAGINNLSANKTSGDITIRANDVFQKKVGSCAGNDAIQSINSDTGSVTCYKSPRYCVYKNQLFSRGASCLQRLEASWCTIATCGGSADFPTWQYSSTVNSGDPSDACSLAWWCF